MSPTPAELIGRAIRDLEHVSSLPANAAQAAIIRQDEARELLKHINDLRSQVAQLRGRR